MPIFVLIWPLLSPFWSDVVVLTLLLQVAHRHDLARGRNATGSLLWNKQGKKNYAMMKWRCASKIKNSNNKQFHHVTYNPPPPLDLEPVGNVTADAFAMKQ